MLVLARKTGEGIKIGDDIFIDVVGLYGGRVKLGITAPSEFRISRYEEDYGHVRGKDREDDEE